MLNEIYFPPILIAEGGLHLSFKLIVEIKLQKKIV